MAQCFTEPHHTFPINLIDAGRLDGQEKLLRVGTGHFSSSTISTSSKEPNARYWAARILGSLDYIQQGSQGYEALSNAFHYPVCSCVNVLVGGAWFVDL